MATGAVYSLVWHIGQPVGLGRSEALQELGPKQNIFIFLSSNCSAVFQTFLNLTYATPGNVFKLKD